MILLHKISSACCYERVEASFSRQGLMKVIGAVLGNVDEGSVEIILPHSERVTQQQGGFHGGAVGAIADIAAGYASLTVAPEGMEVVTVEYKINFMSAFTDGELVAKGRVLKAGKRVIVSAADVFHVNPANGDLTLCACLQQTVVPVPMKY